MQFAADEFRAANRPLYSDEVNQISLYHRLQTIFYQKEVLSYHSENTCCHSGYFFIQASGCSSPAVKYYVWP